jgi:ribA/ribD-fused uncharacterized protein
MAERLQQIQKIGKTCVQVIGDNYLNCSKGVVSSSEFEGISDTDLKSMFSSVAVEVKRFNRKSGNDWIPSNSILITFNNPVLPKAVKFGYMSFRVKPFFPRPMRCFDCQKYGHTKTRCRGTKTCGKCGADDQDHDFDHCSAAPHCPQCGESHPVWSGACEVLKREQELVQIITQSKVPRREAITVWEMNHSPLRYYDILRNRTYAKVAQATGGGAMESNAVHSEESGRGVGAGVGAGRGRGGSRGRGGPQPDRSSFHNSGPSSSYYESSTTKPLSSYAQPNRFSALLNEKTQSEPMDSSGTSKKRTLSNGSINSTSSSISNSPSKPSKCKLTRTLPKRKPLSGSIDQVKEGDTTYFYGEKSIYSNFHTHKVFQTQAPKGFKPAVPLKDNQMNFETTEKLYQFRKAWYFGDIQTSKSIYAANRPGRCKELGRKFKSKDSEWHEVAVDVMCECQYRKYSNDTLQKQLTTGTYKFVELTSRDNFWGSGSDFFGEGEGQNWMGRILHSLRLYLLGQLPDSDLLKSKFDNIKDRISLNDHKSFEIVHK